MWPPPTHLRVVCGPHLWEVTGNMKLIIQCIKNIKWHSCDLTAINLEPLKVSGQLLWKWGRRERWTRAGSQFFIWHATVTSKSIEEIEDEHILGNKTKNLCDLCAHHSPVPPISHPAKLNNFPFHPLSCPTLNATDSPVHHWCPRYTGMSKWKNWDRNHSILAVCTCGICIQWPHIMKMGH